MEEDTVEFEFLDLNHAPLVNCAHFRKLLNLSEPRLLVRTRGTFTVLPIALL